MELQKAVADLINKSLSVFDKAGVFLEEQLPDVLYQLLLWHGVKSFIYFSAWVSIFAICSYVMFKQSTKFKNDSLRESEVICLMGVFSVGPILVIISLAGIFSRIEWLQIWISPKIFLIEYAAEIIK